MKISNNKGSVLFYAPLIAIIAICAPLEARGVIGRNGTDNLEARHKKIIDAGGHINTAPNSQRQTFDYYVQP